MGKNADFLKECELFYNLTRVQLDLVDNICEEHVYPSGTLITNENSSEKELYLILRGEVEILVSPNLISPTDEQLPYQSIATLRRGQSFGEIALVDQGIRTASVRATQQNTILLQIHREKLLFLCESYPEMGYRIMLNLASDLAQKIRNANLKIRESLLFNIRQIK